MAAADDTPFTPAIEAWHDAARELESAVRNLAGIRTRSALARRSASGGQEPMTHALDALTAEARACRVQVANVIRALEAADARFAGRHHGRAHSRPHQARGGAPPAAGERRPAGRAPGHYEP